VADDYAPESYPTAADHEECRDALRRWSRPIGPAGLEGYHG
jgi:hypothetical protein